MDASHAGVDGWYPFVMPMTQSGALIGGREVFGEPKKLGEVTVERDGLVVHASLVRPWIHTGPGSRSGLTIVYQWSSTSPRASSR